MSLKEGQSTNRPPLLEGPNYAYWKSKMKAFLKSLYERAWRAVMIGWTEPIMANPEGVGMPKPEALWSEADDVAAVGNSKALNAIFYGVDENVFKLIAECEVAKEAWDILRIAYEGPESESNDEEEEHENVNLVGHIVTIEDGSETSENPYSSTLSEQPIDDASSSDDEGLAHETSAEMYKELYEKCLLVIGLNKKLTETVASLTEEKDKKWQEVELLLAQKVKLLDIVSVLKSEMEKNRETHPAGLVELRRKNAELSRKEVHLLNKVESLELQIEMERDNHAATMKELSKFKGSAKMLNSGSKNLESILRSQRIEDGHRGLGFNGNSGSDKTSSVKAKPKPAQRAEQSVNHYPEKQLGNRGRKQLMPNRGRHGTEWRRNNRTCWYCYQMGHIKSRCRLLLAEQKVMEYRVTPRVRQVWKPKSRKEVCLVALSSFSHMKEECWYLDSGCSTHMTGNPQYLINVKPIRKRQFVTFEDGGEGQVIGCGTLKVPDLPELEDILLVDGLKVNLISISRLCDEGQSVTFTCHSCQVLDWNGDTLLEGSRSTNKSYCLGTVGTRAATVCPTNMIHEMKLQGTGMVSSSRKVKDKDAINSIPEDDKCRGGTPSETPVLTKSIEDKVPGGPSDEATLTPAGTLDNAPALQPSWRIKSRGNEIKCRELAACSSSPKNVIKAFIDEVWVVAIHVELEELIRYEAWKVYHLVHSHELKATIYGLTQAPRAWYKTFLIDHRYERGGVEKHIFTKYTSTQKLVG
ncbi:unnamed protein product [Rhodiola kirilowii]